MPTRSTAVMALVLSTAWTPLSALRTASESDRGSLTLKVRDASGEPLIARVMIAPASYRERVRLGRWGDLRTIVEQQGTTVPLPEGDYQITVSHGPEWSIAEARIAVIAGKGAVRLVTLEHQVALSGWQGAELHVHTERSTDARERGGVQARDLRAEGVELAVATDHNLMGDLGPGIDSVRGAELTTWDPEVGHFNAFPLQRLPNWLHTNPMALLGELAEDTSVFVQVNHPRLEDHIGYFALGGFDGERFRRADFHLDIDGLEVWNGYDLARPRHVERLLSEWRHWVAGGRHLTPTGGSDSHGAAGHLPGYPRTYVRAEGASQLAPSLKAGRAFVTNGPLVGLRVEGKEPGDTVSARNDGTVTAEISVYAPDWMSVQTAEIWAGDVLVWTRALPKPRVGSPLRFTERVRIQVNDANTVQATVHGGDGLDKLLGRGDVEPLAFTNAVFLDHGPIEPLQNHEAGHASR